MRMAFSAVYVQYVLCWSTGLEVTLYLPCHLRKDWVEGADIYPTFWTAPRWLEIYINIHLTLMLHILPPCE